MKWSGVGFGNVRERRGGIGRGKDWEGAYGFTGIVESEEQEFCAYSHNDRSETC